MKVEYVHSTQGGDNLIAYIARVSNPKNQENFETAPKLINYLIEHGHWSPFEMASLCVEINTTRDIGRQILRHRSFSFQEFSQRYQDVTKLPPAELREARLQDSKNRQNSIITDDEDIQRWWKSAQELVVSITNDIYQQALSDGIGKEVARSILPEGLTSTRMYMHGTIRSWIHFLKARLYSGAQKEIREVAQAVDGILKEHYPDTHTAIQDYIYN
jgi:thymidylate synthase (FAD)